MFGIGEKKFSGTVRALFGDDRGSAIVEVSSGAAGMKLAQIGGFTEGVSALTDSQTGAICLGAKVEGVGKKGQRLFIATKIRRGA